MYYGAFSCIKEKEKKGDAQNKKHLPKFRRYHDTLFAIFFA